MCCEGRAIPHPLLLFFSETVQRLFLPVALASSQTDAPCHVNALTLATKESVRGDLSAPVSVLKLDFLVLSLLRYSILF